MEFFPALIVMAIALAQGSPLDDITNDDVSRANILSDIERAREELAESEQNHTRLQELTSELEQRIQHHDVFARLASLEDKIRDTAMLPRKCLFLYISIFLYFLIYFFISLQIFNIMIRHKNHICIYIIMFSERLSVSIMECE